MDFLTVSKLLKSYAAPEGGRLAVVDVPEFSLAAGAQVALRGGSGSGKTTFLNLIAGILTPDTGEISLGGERMTGRSEAARDRLRATTLGYVFQTFNLLQGCTCLENVELGMAFGGRGRDRVRAKALLERMGLGTRMEHRPGQLSVGQQQRVAVARALANRPRLVLADEPTGNLDQANAREALTLIRETCREEGSALLLVSHDEEVLAGFDDLRDFRTLNLATQEAAR